MKEKGIIYLLPSSLGDPSPDVLPGYACQTAYSISFFIVENEKSARRFLRSIGYKRNFEEGMMLLMHRDENFLPTKELTDYLLSGKNVGVIAEAGSPGIADPGAAVVSWAHRNNIRVVPLVGPSSIFLALMASGLNGQQFVFHGYLPVKPTERRKHLKQLEEESRRKNETQIFIETPYRNDSLLKDILNVCKPTSRLCIASDITLLTEKIFTQAVSAWRKNIPDLKKKPTIFLLLA